MFLKGTGQIVILKRMKKNVNSAKNKFFDTVNSALNKYAPINKVYKYWLRFKKIIIKKKKKIGLLLVFTN